MKTILKLAVFLFVVSAMRTTVRADSFPTVTLQLATPSTDTATIGTAVGGGPGATVSAPGPAVNLGGAYLGPYPYTLSNPQNFGTNPLLATQLFGTMTPNQNTATVSLSGFCIALTTDISVGTSYPNFSIEPATLANVLRSNFSSSVVNNPSSFNDPLDNVLKLMWDYHLAGGNLQTPTPGVLSDALTVAIWEVLDGTGADHAATSGFLVNGGVNDISITNGSSGNVAAGMTLANKWLNGDPGLLTPVTDTQYDLGGIGTQGTELSPDDLYALVDSGVQTQSIVLGVNPDVVSHTLSTPEPRDYSSLAGLAFVGLSAGAVVAIRRRRAIG